MKIGNRPKRTEHQNRLFPDPVGGHGHIRVLLGELTEVLTAKFFRGTRLRTSGDVDYCPDVKCDGYYLECKCMGLSNSTLIYAGRHAKDKLFSVVHPLFYVVWHHTLDTRLCRTMEEVEYGFIHSLKTIYVVPFEVIETICRMMPVTKLDSNYGNSRDNARLYGGGYRIPVKLLRTPHTLVIPIERSPLLW